MSKPARPTRTVLLVDDSATARLALRRAIERPGSALSVVGEAGNWDRALTLAKRLEPDLVTMDVYLGDHDGVELTRAIMMTSPTRVAIVTGADSQDPDLVFRAVEAGGLEVLPKLPAVTHPSYETRRGRFVRVLRALADVPVVTRRATRNSGTTGLRAPSTVRLEEGEPELRRASLVVIGASTGGPPLLHSVLAEVSELRVPVLLVQHIQPGFGEKFAEWLGDVTSHDVVYCKQRERLRPGVVYAAPDDAHLVLEAFDTIAPFDAPPRLFQKPSIDELFSSVAQLRATGTLGVLLTGMGRDGAEGLRLLRARGAHTIAQLPSSCVVDSMPQTAIDLGAATEVLGPRGITDRLRRIAGAPETTRTAS